MRVLHIYSGNLFGGIEAILTAIARNRSAAADVLHEFALCFDGRLAEELKRDGATVHQLAPVHLRRPQSARAARRLLARLFEPRAFDRVICHAPWTQGIFGGIVRRANLPLVFWAHDVMTGRHWTERLARLVAPDFVVCNSQFTASTLQHLYPGVASRVIYAPVNLPPAEIDAEQRRRIRASVDTPESAVVVIQACRSEQWKGHELLVEALSRLRDVPGWLWWQVGGAQRPAEESFLASLRRAAAAAGIADRVRWLGQRTDVPDLLRAADICCQPNLGPEPFGIAFVEALAAGLPVVTTRLGGATEIVEESCGALLPPGDVSALAAVLRQLVCEPGRRNQLAAAGPARARTLCDPATQCLMLATALEQMAPVGVGA
jgi:glycosyltransferase involved in cell wall biosynthesis